MEEQELKKINGLITYIKVTKEGEKFTKKWKLYSIKLDTSDVFYSAFGGEDNDPYSHYSEGDEVTLEYVIVIKDDDTYHNIKSIKMFSQEGETKFEEYLNNSSNKEMDEPIQEMISSGIFSGEFNINGILYEISIKRK